MQQEFNNHINKNFVFLRDSKILIAISGGIDSVVLTYLLQQSNFDISLAHCNFNLRGKESDKDEEFVKNLAKKLNIPFFVTHFKTKQYAKKNKLSIQETARNLRYQWFEELLKNQSLDYVLTAHNLNDNLETFLINFTRGTGLQGLTGIPKINKKILRPLLEFSREQIEDFVKENKIIWREDQSNADIKYTRNKIRHQVLPILKEINPNILNSFKNTISHLKDSETIANERVAEVKKEVFDINKSEERRIVSEEGKSVSKLNIQKIQNLKHPKAYLYQLLKEYGFTEWNDILNLLTAQSGKQLFSKTHRLIKDREYLLLVLREQRKEIRDKRKDIRIKENDKTFKIQHSTFNIQTKLCDSATLRETQFDKNLLKFPLKVRKWQKGDYFYPIGMTGKKKLSKFFKDEKYSLLEKENIWLLLSDNKIVWIIGKRQDNRFKITETTTKILEITTIT